jgi:hypothetical protein
MLACLCSGAAGQSSSPDPATDPSGSTTTAPPVESKRLLGIVPNYRSSQNLQNYQPLTPAEKFRIASEDSLDRGTFILAGVYAAQAQWANANRSFDQGAAGFGKYFGAAYGDLIIGNYMTESVFRILLHQDPRYFSRGAGSGWSRLRYAVGQIF